MPTLNVVNVHFKEVGIYLGFLFLTPAFSFVQQLLRVGLPVICNSVTFSLGIFDIITSPPAPKLRKIGTGSD